MAFKQRSTGGYGAQLTGVQGDTASLFATLPTPRPRPRPSLELAKAAMAAANKPDQGTQAPQAASADGSVSVSGTVSRIIFRNDEDSFYIFVVQPFGTKGAHEEVKVKGYAHDLNVSQEVDCTGVWEANRNPKYKDELTLKASGVSEHIPTTKAGLLRMLENGFVKGIGAKWARELVDHFGANLLDVVERSPVRLLELPGFGEARARAFEEAVKEKRAVPRIMAFLADLDLGPGLSHRVFKTLGVDAVRLIKESPYVLTSVPQIAFATADRIAMKAGVFPESKERIEAGCKAVLMQEAASGSTAVPADKLLQSMSDLLAYTPAKAMLGEKVEIPMREIGNAVERVLSEGKVAVGRILDGGVRAVSLREHYIQEKRIGEKLAKLNRAVTKKMRSVDLSSPHFAHLDKSQLDAVRMALTSNVSIITGRPGCGKTTVTKSIIKALEDAGISFMACGPTGRAAKRFMEATGYPATTTHRALESKGGNTFERDEFNPLEADFIIADEQSMADTFMSYRLLKAVASGSQLLYIGDVDQLSSIDPGQVLKDLIDSGMIPVTRLTKIHRQAEGSQIITNAHKAIEGMVPVSAGEGSDFRIRPCKYNEQVDEVIEQYRQLLKKGFAPDDIQILTPMRKKTALGCNELNRRLKEVLNSASELESIKRGKFEDEVFFSAGDRVMQVANNKELGIFNGDIGYIKSVDKQRNELVVDFNGDEVTLGVDDLNDLDLAYATTVHKSQGSEFPAVIIPMSNSHMRMWDRNLFYTAITRGKSEVVVTGDTYLLKSVVEKQFSKSRLTGLRTEIIEAFAALRAELGEDNTPSHPSRQSDARGFARKAF